MSEKIHQFWDRGPMVTTGCTKVSPGCENCWSERAHVMRMNNPAVSHIYNPDLITNGRFNGKVQFNLHLLEKAAKRKKPQVYAIWNDLYHEGVTDEQIEKAFDEMICESDQHMYLIVTKRPERAAQYHNEGPGQHFVSLNYKKNIWHIVTCENQAMADKRIPHLLRIPGKRAIIIEPCLEYIQLGLHKRYEHHVFDTHFPGANPIFGGDYLHQVILGPENGPGKRPFDPAWADSVKAQCKAAGVPFYRKDTGEGELVWRR